MISGLAKLAAKLAVFVLAFAGWQWRKYDARRRLREIDEGKRCVSCEKTETEVRDGVVRCLLCNHSERLANIQAVQLSEGEIDAMTHREPRN
jgi:hypothetical protein